MKQTIINFFKNQNVPEGFILKEIIERCELSPEVKDVKAILSELKQEGFIVSVKTRYILAQHRPDLLPKPEAAKSLARHLSEFKKDSTNHYPPTLSEFCLWLQNRAALKTSEIQSWIGKSDKEALLVFDPSRNDRVLLLKTDLSLILNADLVESVSVELLRQIKDNESNHYPCPLAAFTKRLINSIQEKVPGFPLSAKTLELYLKSPSRFCVIAAGKKKSVRLPEYKPKDPQEYLTETLIDKCANDVLQGYVRTNLSKYPCSKNDFKKALLKEVNKRIPHGSVEAKDLDRCIPLQSRAFQIVKSGNTEKVCLTGHDLLIQPPKGDELKKLLLELIELRASLLAGASLVSAPNIDIDECETLFWQEHKRLDEIGFRDRAVPIPKLWNALKNRMNREQFEAVLQTLSDRRAIQLERRTTMDGLTQEEKDACYRVDDILFYIARRLS
ncbi:MAG: hypothetical protein AB1656_08220 [Candidatus Omnitrophota bacterium]